MVREPSREFQAGFIMLAIVWFVFCFTIFIKLSSVVPDDVRPHMVLYPLQILFMLIGMIALVVMPLRWLWLFVTEVDD